jgi:hypothetical protein
MNIHVYASPSIKAIMHENCAISMSVFRIETHTFHMYQQQCIIKVTRPHWLAVAFKYNTHGLFKGLSHRFYSGVMKLKYRN